jgi:hypothetical protein
VWANSRERPPFLGFPLNFSSIHQAAERCYAAGHAANEIDWKLATTLAGVAAVLRFAIEAAGMEGPDTDTIGPDGCHYELRATMVAAIEALVKVQAGKAVQA